MKKKVWLIVGFFSLISIYGLNLFRGKMVDFVGLKLIGAETAELDPDSLTLADFSDIPGVTEEYVNAYKLFLKSKAGDKKGEAGYSNAAASFQKIAATTKNPELKLRSLYLVTFCNFLDRKIDEAYKSGIEVFRLSKSLYKDDQRVKLLDKIITDAEKKKLTPSSLKGLINNQEINGFVDELANVAEGTYQIKRMQEKKKSLDKETENFFKDFSAKPTRLVK